MTEAVEPLLAHRPLPEGTVTFLFSDIVGSTPLWENHPTLMKKALQIHNRALQAAILANQGVIFKIVGDAFQAAFPTASQALLAAVESQRNLQQADWNALGPLNVRMGIHTGEAYRDQQGDEYAVSHTKNRVARIMSAGHGGQILLSDESANLCREVLTDGLELKDLGEHYLKGLARAEHIFQVLAPGLVQEFPPLVVAQRPVYNLPSKLTPFFGRKKETAQVQSLLASHRLVTIIGPGGVGKTRLALNVAQQLKEKYKDGVYFAILDPLKSPDEIPPAVAAALQVPLRGQVDTVAHIIAFLQSREILLVLDNFENLLDGSQLLVDLLEGAPNLILLVTSREALNLMEEWRFYLKGLAYTPCDHTLSPDPRLPADVASQDAVQLFIDRARRARPDFSPEDEYPHILHICELVEGYPLALELAAAWARTLSCAEIVAEIEANISILSTTMRNLPERHRSLQAIFDQSWNQLDPETQDVFMRLSVFRNGFRRDAAERVAGATLLELSNLVDKSLLRRETDRYQIHRLLRGYAEEKLSANPKIAAQTIQRYSSYFSSFIYDRFKYYQNQDHLDVLKEMDQEIDNIRLAWEWLLESQNIHELRIFVLSLDFYYQLRSGFREWWQMLLPAAEMLEKMDSVPERDIALAEVYTTQAWMAIRLGKFDQAEEQINLSLQLFAKPGTPPPQGIGMDPTVAQAILLNIRGEYQQAYEVSQQGLVDNLQRGDTDNTPFYYYALAGTASALGRFSAAQEYTQKAIDLCNQLDNDWFKAYCLNEKGILERAQDNYELAKSHFQESYAIRESFQDPEGMAVALNHLGQIALLEEDYNAALSLFQRSRGLYQDLADQGGLANVLAGLGEAYLGIDDLPSACENLIQALQIAVEIEYVPFVFSALAGAGHLLVCMDHLKTGLHALELSINHPASAQEVKSRAERYYLASQGSLPVSASPKTAGDEPDAIWQEARLVLAELDQIHASR